MHWGPMKPSLKSFLKWWLWPIPKDNTTWREWFCVYLAVMEMIAIFGLHVPMAVLPWILFALWTTWCARDRYRMATRNRAQVYTRKDFKGRWW